MLFLRAKDVYSQRRKGNIYIVITITKWVHFKMTNPELIYAETSKIPSLINPFLRPGLQIDMEVYDTSELEFRLGAEAIVGKRLAEAREHLTACVERLKLLEGPVVETTEGLPRVRDINYLSLCDLSGLLVELQERYYPEPRDFGREHQPSYVIQ